MFLTKSNLIEQAYIAAQQQNWSLVNQFLQQMARCEETSSLYSPQAVSSYSSENMDGSLVVDLALTVLKSGDFQAKWEVAKVFPDLGDSAIAPLLAILQDENADTEVRWFAGRILGQFDRPAAIAALVELVNNDEDEELSEMAADALANLGANAIHALVNLLSLSSSRLLVVRSLAQIRRREVIEPLLSVVHDELSSIRSVAVEALSNFDDPRIPPVLVAALEDRSASVRREAVIGLGLWGMRPSAQSSSWDLAKLLCDRLWDIDLEVCKQAAIALGRLRTQAAADALVDVLQSSATPLALQIEAVRSLGWIGTAYAVDHLQQAIKVISCIPSSGEVIQEIVTVLGRIEQEDLKPQVAEILIHLLERQRQSGSMQLASIKQAITTALGQLGQKPAINSLMQLLADPDASVRLHAIAAIKYLDPQEACDQLETHAGENVLTPVVKEGVEIPMLEFSTEEQ